MNMKVLRCLLLAIFCASLFIPHAYSEQGRRTKKTAPVSEDRAVKEDIEEQTEEVVEEQQLTDQEVEVIQLFKMVNSGNSRTRRLAYKRLREMGESAVPVYIKILLDGRRSDREFAAKMLGEYPTEEGVLALRKALLNDNMARVRLACADSLALIADRSSLDDLVKALQDSNKEVKEKVIYAIGKMGDKEVVPALIELLSDENPDTRKMVVYSMGELRDEKCTPYLIKATIDPDSGVRAASAIALAKIGNKSATPEIIGMLNDESSDVRLSAVMALNILDDRRAVQPLVKLLSDINGDVRRMTFDTLKKMDQSALTGGLIEAMSSQDESTRIDSSAWLAEVADVKAVPTLIKGTKDKVWQVRYYSTIAL
ncbi:MAG: HEAT repeat domain-containing protein, partial [Candidatus Aureabacteria bacterium]|nr:HEAT repeat domain-containing protein [Candidatus Auribacterota bacterium]